MNRRLTTRESVLLAILLIIAICLGYFKLILEPINEDIERYDSDADTEEMEITTFTPRLQKLRDMEKELDEIRSDGTALPIPSFDNSGELMQELHSILNDTYDYSLNFGNAYSPEKDYIIRRPVSLSFTTDTYEEARAIFDAIHDSDNLNQVSKMDIISTKDKDEEKIKTTLNITFFEVKGK